MEQAKHYTSDAPQPYDLLRLMKDEDSAANDTVNDTVKNIANDTARKDQ